MLELCPLNREASHTDALLIEDHDSSGRQELVEGFEIGQQQVQLLQRPPINRASEENDGGFSDGAESEERAKVGVDGNNDSILLSSEIEEDIVVSRVESDVSDVDGILAVIDKSLCNDRGHAVVDEEFHEALRNGSSRSRRASEAYRSASAMSSRSRSG